VNAEQLIQRVQRYDGPPIRVMEVCGTHTAAIARSGLRALLPESIRLVSGPGCPVCVTEPGFIDALRELSLRPGHRVFAFGDMLRVPGSGMSLSGAKAVGGRVTMFLGPRDVIDHAAKHPDETCVVAAVGFETTAPVYALLLLEAERAGLTNIRMVSALKTMIQPLRALAAAENAIDAFLCPGHVAVLTGSDVFTPLAKEFQKPFVIAGFEPQDILRGLVEILDQIETGKPRAANLYPRAVTKEGNMQAMNAVARYFEPADARWRGIGEILGSGLRLRKEYEKFDAWPGALPRGTENPACRCGDVMLGRIMPSECPMFLRGCDPMRPVGACMVSAEGSCGIWAREAGA
jgi:hydrogenase expression/formation protein HypD